MMRRRLDGIEVSAIGLGAPVYGEPNADAVIPTLHRALDRELIELADQDHLPQQLDLVGLSSCHVFLQRPAASC